MSLWSIVRLTLESTMSRLVISYNESDVIENYYLSQLCWSLVKLRYIIVYTFNFRKMIGNSLQVWLVLRCLEGHWEGLFFMLLYTQWGRCCLMGWLPTLPNIALLLLVYFFVFCYVFFNIILFWQNVFVYSIFSHEKLLLRLKYWLLKVNIRFFLTRILLSWIYEFCNMYFFYFYKMFYVDYF